MTSRGRQPLFLIGAAALALTASGYAATGGVGGDHRDHGRPSVKPPPKPPPVRCYWRWEHHRWVFHCEPWRR
jgi:hypothetical protein